jgi:hypothetical protein
MLSWRLGLSAEPDRVYDALQGFRAARAGLLTNTYLLAQSVTLDKRSYQALAAVTEEQRSVIEVRWLVAVDMPASVLTAAWGRPAGDCLSRVST